MNSGQTRLTPVASTAANRLTTYPGEQKVPEFADNLCLHARGPLGIPSGESGEQLLVRHSDEDPELGIVHRPQADQRQRMEGPRERLDEQGVARASQPRRTKAVMRLEESVDITGGVRGFFFGDDPPHFVELAFGGALGGLARRGGFEQKPDFRQIQGIVR